MAIDKDIPAFPRTLTCLRPPDEARIETYTGMTLMDYFAGQALSGLSSNDAIMESMRELAKREGKSISRIMAECCYEYADAMLKERVR